ncbi:hypothetical protein MLP_15960 [Microlunatus phosphovorus NM-1]|uniref:Uncharacterized protein n=1 Tax=Microlunatus phosphovorus (strain ATCC 700054 / DSM 10555 / JCM 9379 / NBRC 101784 / NCIMB 13414 / VKM Ac-1990 / NM-1) TaxID=1032480 RepID=F5XRC0_MICPN|nr:hypothetical protein MLP_15960 [Microlunatus phosphovorus NM-1]
MADLDEYLQFLGEQAVSKPSAHSPDPKQKPAPRHHPPGCRSPEGDDDTQPAGPVTSVMVGR